ncbi:hypothetical protein ACO229_06450 [Promicromonospora sp. MS192]|uniref:hypothetical protein n=1 Tax=Promicromonospora sp. MS192 TaxID=3412684 RepID=UPI003C2AB3C9
MSSPAFPEDGSFSLDHPVVQADMLATWDHSHTSATMAHTRVARHAWRVLRELGVTGGRMLVRGLEPEAFAGLPEGRRVLDPLDHGDLQADVPPGDWPHRGLELTPFHPSYMPGQFDVVLHNTPFSDVVYQDGAFREGNWQVQSQAVLSSLAYTAPGGFAVVLVGSDVLDAPRAQPRRAMAQLADLIGAARLPAGALRNVAGCDSPVDLLLMRRRPDDQRPGGAEFALSREVTVDSVPVRLNEYFDQRPGDLLGRPVARPMPWGPARLSIQPDAVPLVVDLRTTLDQFVRNARSWQLIAEPTTMPDAPGDTTSGPPGNGPTRQPRDTPGRRSADHPAGPAGPPENRTDTPERSRGDDTHPDL